MSMKLYVGGLSYDTTDEQLNALFAEHGKVDSSTIIKDKYSGESKGFAFVEMAEVKEGQNAIKALNDTRVGGRTIAVKQARPQGGSSRPNFSGGYRRY